MTELQKKPRPTVGGMYRRAQNGVLTPLEQSAETKPAAVAAPTQKEVKDAANGK